jgi:hypothetical protein
MIRYPVYNDLKTHFMRLLDQLLNIVSRSKLVVDGSVI